MRILLTVVAMSVLLLSGCAATKHWSATGGSRSDAVVRLSYEYGMFEVPQVDEQEAILIAGSRCKIWGYSGAEAFGGVIRVCNMYDSYGGCTGWLVTKDFQCTGTGS